MQSSTHLPRRVDARRPPGRATLEKPSATGSGGGVGGVCGMRARGFRRSGILANKISSDGSLAAPASVGRTGKDKETPARMELLTGQLLRDHGAGAVWVQAETVTAMGKGGEAERGPEGDGDGTETGEGEETHRISSGRARSTGAAAWVALSEFNTLPLPTGLALTRRACRRFSLSMGRLNAF